MYSPNNARDAYRPGIRERQIAFAMLAHTCRHDDAAVSTVLDFVVFGDDIRAEQVIAALLDQVESGIAPHDRDDLAEWFSRQAQELAAQECDGGLS